MCLPARQPARLCRLCRTQSLYWQAAGRIFDDQVLDGDDRSRPAGPAGRGLGDGWLGIHGLFGVRAAQLAVSVFTSHSLSFESQAGKGPNENGLG